MGNTGENHRGRSMGRIRTALLGGFACIATTLSGFQIGDLEVGRAHAVTSGETVPVFFDGFAIEFTVVDVNQVNGQTLTGEIGGQQFILQTDTGDFNLIDAATFGDTLDGLGANITLTDLQGTLLFSGPSVNFDELALFNFLVGLFGIGDFIAQTDATAKQAETSLRTISRLLGNRLGSVLSQIRASADSDNNGGFGTLAMVGADDAANGLIGETFLGQNIDGFGVWASPTITSIRSKTLASRFDGTSKSVYAGGDLLLSGDYGQGQIVGAVAGFDRTDLTLFSTGGDLQRDTISALVYGAHIIDSVLSIDGFFGTGLTWTDKQDGFGEGKYKGYQLLAGLNGTAVHTLESFQVTSTVGWSYVYDKSDNYTTTFGNNVGDQKSIISRLSLGPTVRYIERPDMQPYAGIVLEVDMKNTSSNDTTGLLGRVGFDYFADEGLTSTVEYSGLMEREGQHEHSLTLNVRWDF